jgi:hypothetical protein
MLEIDPELSDEAAEALQKLVEEHLSLGPFNLSYGEETDEGYFETHNSNCTFIGVSE